MELAQYLAPVRKWWWLLLAAAVLAAVSSYIVISQQPFIYEAKATLRIGRSFDDPNPTGGELYLVEQLAYTYADIAQRQAVRDSTKAALGLDWLPNYIVQPLPNSQLLEIAVRDANPELAQAIANELANQLILQSPTASRPEDQEREDFVNDQLNSLQDKIIETEQELIEKEEELGDAFSAREITELETDIAGLQSKLTTLQSNYASLLANTQGGAVNALTLIEPALLPVDPVGPRKLYTVLMTSALAVALAAGTAYILEYLDDTIKSEEDIKSIGNLPTLAGVPNMSPKENPVTVVTLEQPRNPASEVFRALRAMVQLKLKDKSCGLLLVTSVSPEEGKSLITANLAVVLAQAGNKTLLVDADLRRPVQHKLFGISNDNGLAELLLEYSPNGNSKDVRKLQERMTKQSDQKDLDILLAGSETSNHHHLISLEILGEMLPAAAERYNYVLLDSPPLLAAADALLLSTMVDGVILVARMGRTRRKELQMAVRQLQEVEANVIGVILNRVNNSQADYYRYGQYYYDRSSDALPVQEEKETVTGQNGNENKKVSESEST